MVNKNYTVLNSGNKQFLTNLSYFYYFSFIILRNP